MVCIFWRDNPNTCWPWQTSWQPCEPLPEYYTEPDKVDCHPTHRVARIPRWEPIDLEGLAQHLPNLEPWSACQSRCPIDYYDSLNAPLFHNACANDSYDHK